MSSKHGGYKRRSQKAIKSLTEKMLTEMREFRNKKPFPKRPKGK